MSKFTIDLLSGDLYLFSGEFNGSGTTSGTTYSAVNLYSDLPTPASASGQIYVVRSSTGIFLANRKSSGFYFSNGSSWSYLGETPNYFKSDNFQVYDSADNTKGLMFITSGITTDNFRNLTIQNSDGTIAYLTDVNLKLDTSLFNTYTGNTVTELNSKLDTSLFNTYTGDTLTQINTKLDTSIFNTFTGTTLPAILKSIGRIVVTGSTYTPTINDKIIGIKATTGTTVTISLPLISLIGEIYWQFKDEGFNASNNPITFSASTGNYLENNLSNISMNVNGGSLSIYNDNNNNWFII
jgi:hypothetical protein